MLYFVGLDGLFEVCSELQLICLEFFVLPSYLGDSGIRYHRARAARAVDILGRLSMQDVCVSVGSAEWSNPAGQMV